LSVIRCIKDGSAQCVVVAGLVRDITVGLAPLGPLGGDGGTHLFIQGPKFTITNPKREVSVRELGVLILFEPEALADHAIGTFGKAAGEATLFDVQPILDANTNGGVGADVATEVGADVVLGK